MVLLDVLAKQTGLTLVVAHYDHGIRSDAQLDRELVQRAAQHYGLNFVYDEGHLGAGASEQTARNARYAFLRKVKQASKARAIITAHHQDDLIETALLNMLRGTRRRGLTSLKSTDEIIRPLLTTPKSVLVNYAATHKLIWHEDSTNSDARYLRNHVRQTITARMSSAQRAAFLELLQNLTVTNGDLDAQLMEYVRMHSKEAQLNRGHFIQLPHIVAREVLATWLHGQGLGGYDHKALERLVIMLKTLPPGKQADVSGGTVIKIGKSYLRLSAPERK